MSTKADFLTLVGNSLQMGNSALVSQGDLRVGNSVSVAAHGMADGFGPVRITLGDSVTELAALPAGLALNTDYWVMPVQANGGFDSAAVRFASSAANAVAGTAVNITGVGVDNFKVTRVVFNGTFTAASVNTGTDAVTVTAHGKATGYGPVRLAAGVVGGDALPTGLAAVTDYWLIVVDANTVKFAATLANALTDTAVNITAAGQGTNTVTAAALSKTFDADDVNPISLIKLDGHGKATGFGPLRIFGADTLPAGLADDEEYWIIKVDVSTIRFASSYANAIAGTSVEFTTLGDGASFNLFSTTQTLVDAMDTLVQSLLTAPGSRVGIKSEVVGTTWRDLLNVSSAIAEGTALAAKSDFLTEYDSQTPLLGGTKVFSAPNTTTDVVTCTAHGRETGFGPVRLNSAGGNVPAGLTSVTNYWLIVVDANTVAFAVSEAAALAGTRVNITGAGTGVFSMYGTTQSLADSIEDFLNDVATSPGDRVNNPSVNQSKFWSTAAFAVLG